MDTNIKIIIGLFTMIIILILWSIISQKEKFSPLDSRIDNTDIFVICNSCVKNKDPNTLIKKLDSANINYRIYKPINGKIIDMKKLVFQGILKIRSNNLSNNDLSLYLSNMNIWQIFLKSQRNYCVILNDYFDLPNNFKEKISNILANMNNADVVLLSNDMNVNKGYILTKESARKLIYGSLPIVTGINNHILNLNDNGYIKIKKLITF